MRPSSMFALAAALAAAPAGNHGATAPRNDVPLPAEPRRERSRKGRPGKGYKGSDAEQERRIAAAIEKRQRKGARASNRR